VTKNQNEMKVPASQLLIDGLANLNGTLNVSLDTGFTPSAGEVVTVLQSSGITGSFIYVWLPYYSGGSLSYSAGNVILTAS
jgi:hypothetical protein